MKTIQINKIRRVNKEEDKPKNLKKNRSMIDFPIENYNKEKNAKIKITNMKYKTKYNNIVKKAKEEKNDKKDDLSIDGNDDDNNNDEDSNEDKDNNNDEESNNDEDNEEEESNNDEENKNKIEDNRIGEITNNDNLNVGNEKKKKNNDDESYLEDKEIKEENLEESSLTKEFNNLKYQKMGSTNIKYINIEENSFNTEEMNFIKHEDYGCENLRRRSKMFYINKEDINKNNLEEDTSISASIEFDEEEIVIKKLKKLIGRNCNLDLIYQMKKDGNRTIDFHKKVDIKGPTIILFKTIDGYNFGGFTSKSFKSSGGWIKDPESFLFNFNTLSKFKIKNGSENAALFYGNATKYGPEFYDILINSGEIQNGTIFPANYLNKIEDLKEGEAEFTCYDVLVYRVNLM